MNDTTQGSPLRFGGAAQQDSETDPNLDKTTGASEPEPRGQPGGESSAAANARMVEGLVAFEVAAGNDPTNEEPPKYLYSSKPIERFELGRFAFQDGYLGFYEEADAAEFEDLVRQQPTYTVVNIRRLAGAAPVKRAPAFQQGVDTTANTTDGRGAGASV